MRTAHSPARAGRLVALAAVIAALVLCLSQVLPAGAESAAGSWDEVAVRGGVSVQKVDADTGTAASQGDASLAGATFEIVSLNDSPVSVGGETFDKGDVVGTIVTVDGGVATTDSDGDGVDRTLPFGSYELREAAAPEGYGMGETDPIGFDISEDGVVVALETSVADPVLRGGLELHKSDVDLDALGQGGTAQGAASLAGAEYSVYNASADAVVVGGTSYAPGDEIPDAKMVTDELGVAATAADLLPYGDYTVRETAAPDGYALDGAEYTASVREAGVLAPVQGAGSSGDVLDSVVRGGICLSKSDIDLGSATPQGDATLAGAEFSVYSDNDAPVVVGGQAFQRDDEITAAKMVTDGLGAAATAADLLPYGDYTVRETAAPDGYEVCDATWHVSVRAAGELAALSGDGDSDSVAEAVLRGGLGIAKVDAETGGVDPLGAATLAGATFSVTNASAGPVVVGDRVFQPGEEVTSATMPLVVTEDGLAQTLADELPFGTYELREVSAGQGYLVDESVHTVQVLEAGKVVMDDVAFSDPVARGDFKMVKVESGSMERMGRVAFLVTSNATGESHVVVTDENGEFDSSVPRDSRNANDWLVDESGAVVGDDARLDPTSGVWFYGNADAAGSGPSEGRGALPYDTYTFRELLTSASTGHRLVSFTVSVTSDGQLVDLGTVDDDVIGLHTELLGPDGTHEVESSADVTLTDTLSYTNLDPGAEYTVVGRLVSAQTGEPVLSSDGSEARAETTFTPEEADGTVEVTFDHVDLSSLGTADVVALESLTRDGAEVASHADLNDKDQTVSVKPGLATSASDKATGGHEGVATKTVTVVDKVAYSGLVPGRAYEVHGTLRDAADGSPIADADGQQVSASATFTPEAPDGTVELTFTFSGSLVAGKSVVAFESLTYQGVEYASHADIADADQTVAYPAPEVSTTLTDADGDHSADAGRLTLTDKVAYKGLVAGQAYTLKGTLMEKATGKALTDAQGAEVVAETMFTPDKPDGTAEVKFDVDASKLAGHDLVAFESLVYGDEEVASHADIDDAGQTVSVGKPAIGTELVDKASGTHTVSPSSQMTLVDKVSYSGLVPGQTYTLTGRLMDKATGKALTDAQGAEVTSRVSFTPEASSGSVEVTFTFDGSKLAAGSQSVAYETAYRGGDEVASHADLNDSSQTVTTGSSGGTLSQTGVGPVAAVCAALAIAALAALCLVRVASHRK